VKDSVRTSLVHPSPIIATRDPIGHPQLILRPASKTHGARFHRIYVFSWHLSPSCKPFPTSLRTQSAGFKTYMMRNLSSRILWGSWFVLRSSHAFTPLIPRQQQQLLPLQSMRVRCLFIGALIAQPDQIECIGCKGQPFANAIYIEKKSALGVICYTASIIIVLSRLTICHSV
jgi:hypothetical protein